MAGPEIKGCSIPMETCRCLLCGSENTTVYCTVADFWGEKFDRTYQYVRCSQCSLIYQNPRPEPEEMPAHYGAAYEVFADGVKNGAKNGAIRTSLFANFGKEKRIRLIESIQAQGTLLDVGCATGSFLQSIGSSGKWQGIGIEPDPYAAAIASQKGLQIINQTFEDAALNENSFNVITFWDVIEHLYDPLTTLKKACTLLKDDGIIVLRLPNAGSWDAALFRRYWAGIDAPRHLYLFDQKTIKDLLARAGLRILANNAQIGNYLNFVKSIRFFMAARRWPKYLRKIVLFIFTNPLTRLITYPLFDWIGKNKRGSSMTILAEKGTGGN
jgi:2-polyprenyl-3-methyl-5-hydroxy-6-metoxy-1,4-benzoquinol methylase